MAAEEEVVILARLAGTQQFLVNAEEMNVALKEMGIQTTGVGTAMERTAKRGFLMNQAMFTLRRLVYGSTLAIIALGAESLRLGFNFQSAMQQARVALAPIGKDIGGVSKELTYLFNLTKYTPFQFKDMTIAFRQMYGGMRTVGISAQTVNQTLKAMADALSFTGKTAPGALNRVSIALQHMAFQGHLTGYSVNQLARDGIPIFAALKKELGLTGEQIHSIGALGIPTVEVLKAINKYIESTPGYANAAYRQATGSLHGLFTTFKDNISQLMANMESGVFAHFQNRLVAFNAFFGRISTSMQHHASFQTVVRDAFGGGAAMLWHQFAADLSLVWHIFTGIIGDVARSKAVWGALFASLVLLHGILIPINFFVQHFGFLLYALVPALIAYRTILILDVITTKSAVFWTALFGAETKDLTFLQFLLRGAIIGVTAALKAARIAQGLWSVATLGYVRGAGGQFRAMTALEKMVLRMRVAVISLLPALAGAAASTWAWTAALLANPITWIVVGVLALTAGLVVLYFKWKAFHDAVNTTVSYIWSHPLVAQFIPVIGQLIVMARLMYEIYTHFKAITDLARHPIRGLEHAAGGGGGILGYARTAGHLLGIPGLASGGSLLSAGSVMVGERGPEILRLPRGASVTPLAAGGQGMFTIIVMPQPVNIDGVQVAQIVSDVVTSAGARS